MIDIDYKHELQKIYDFEIEVSSIADCRRVMSVINEQEDMLILIEENVKKDIRSVESQYITNRTSIRKKYDSNKSGILNSLKGPFANNRVKEMKKLENIRDESLEYYYEIKFTAENLLIQTREIKENLQTLMKEMLGNF